MNFFDYLRSMDLVLQFFIIAFFGISFFYLIYEIIKKGFYFNLRSKTVYLGTDKRSQLETFIKKKDILIRQMNYVDLKSGLIIGIAEDRYRAILKPKLDEKENYLFNYSFRQYRLILLILKK